MVKIRNRVDTNFIINSTCDNQMRRNARQSSGTKKKRKKNSSKKKKNLIYLSRQCINIQSACYAFALTEGSPPGNQNEISIRRIKT